MLAEVIADDGYQRRLFILNLDDAYGNGLADAIEANLEARVARWSHQDLRPAGPDLRRRGGEVVGADPDAVVLIGFEESSRILADMVEQGIGPNDIPSTARRQHGQRPRRDFDAGVVPQLDAEHDGGPPAPARGTLRCSRLPREPWRGCPGRAR